jgi:hypothetical protein
LSFVAPGMERCELPDCLLVLVLLALTVAA